MIAPTTFSAARAAARSAWANHVAHHDGCFREVCLVCDRLCAKAEDAADLMNALRPVPAERAAEGVAVR